MPEYLAPGVYIENVPDDAQQIIGVPTSITGFVGEAVRGPVNSRFVSSMAEYERLYGMPRDLKAGYLGFAVRGFFANGGSQAWISRVVASGDKVASSMDILPGYRIDAVGPGVWGNGVRIDIADAGSDQSLFRLTAVLDGTTEVFDDLSLDPGDRRSVANLVNDVATLVRIVPIKGAGPGRPDRASNCRLRGGSTTGRASPEDVIGKDRDDQGEKLPDEACTGLRALARIDEIALLVVPDHHGSARITDAIIEQCETLRDRFAILHFDPATNADLENRGHVLKDTSFGAVYASWFRIPDPSDSTGEATLEIPPSGHIAGLFARVDATVGVFKAPGNEVLLDLTTDDRGGDGPLEPAMGAAAQSTLNSRNVNVIRDFRAVGNGIRPWSARTMSSNPEWRYINVRRLFLYIEQSIAMGTQWTAFEPNAEPLWASVTRAVTDFLDQQWQSGALMGWTAQEAFFVSCDRTTMTEDDISSGRLVCVVGIAPVRPAEFVIFQISQKTMEAS